MDAVVDQRVGQIAQLIPLGEPEPQVVILSARKPRSIASDAFQRISAERHRGVNDDVALEELGVDIGRRAEPMVGPPGVVDHDGGAADERQPVMPGEVRSSAVPAGRARRRRRRPAGRSAARGLSDTRGSARRVSPGGCRAGGSGPSSPGEQRSREMSGVPSEEASSTTMSSSSRSVCPRTLSTAWAMKRSTFRTVITTETRGADALTGIEARRRQCMMVPPARLIACPVT